NQLRGCDLRESSMVHAMLIDVDLRSANFANARMEQVSLVRCTLDGASFLKADLRGMRLAEPCTFVGADLRGAQMDGATLREADFSGADLSGATLCSSDLSKSILRDANLYRVVAKNALFMRADLTGASLIAANLESAIFIKAKLARADFKGANLFRADLLRAVGDDRTSFHDANVRHVRVSPKEAAGDGKLAPVDPAAQPSQPSAIVKESSG
ncbi:MAG TPA: pentapeptide repeat-containing protein, partial [Polyangiaceae bacterium]|nr:pentapeptide repeat-containing protein [Polyangiaceae bacterium]